VGFPRDLTHHTSGNVTRHQSHYGDYDDRGNWTGAVVMYALLFEHEAFGLGARSLLEVFDQEGDRAEVYKYWGPEGQKSGTGQDNDRTNLLESILANMGPMGQRTQRAWDFMLRYHARHPDFITRQEFLRCALVDPAMDIFTDEDSIADAILRELGHGSDIDMAN
jgi:hypothetical protein